MKLVVRFRFEGDDDSIYTDLVQTADVPSYVLPVVGDTVAVQLGVERRSGIVTRRAFTYQAGSGSAADLITQVELFARPVQP